MPSRSKRKKNRSIKPALHIVFEDKKSARYYIQGYKKFKGYGDNIILEPHKHTTPKSLVKQAKSIKKELKNANILNDEIWIVYDAESPRQRDPSQEHAPAWQNAKDAGFNLAISSVSYETWILLHYDNTTKAFNESDNLKKYIKNKYQNNYDKSDENIFSELRTKLSTAIKYAKELEERNEKVNSGKKGYEINPYTDFHKLLKAIDEFNQKS